MSDVLDLAPTKNTPLVKFSPRENKLEIAGESYPENAVEFYQPVLAWLREHLSPAEATLTLHLQLHYFNTSSSKCLLDVLNLLEDFHEAGRPLRVVWQYDETDEDMRESGQEFAEGLSVPFELRKFPA